MRAGSGEAGASDRLSGSHAERSNAPEGSRDRPDDKTSVADSNRTQDRDLDRVASILVTIALRIAQRAERR